MKSNYLCCNIGCVSPRHYDGKRFRSDCSNCHDASYGRIKDGCVVRYKSGVTPIKKDYCENHDGHLGFPCYSKDPFNLSPYQLDIDHIDGNNSNNQVGNLQTLCKLCHSAKTVLNGNNGRKYDRPAENGFENVFVRKDGNILTSQWLPLAKKPSSRRKKSPPLKRINLPNGGSS